MNVIQQLFCLLKVFSVLIFQFSKSSHVVFSTWTKFNSKILEGNSYDFGDFDKCLASQGRYCLVQFTNDQVVRRFMEQSYFNFQWKQQDERSAGAVCVPQQCSANDARNLLNFMFNASELDYQVTDGYNQDEFCKTSNSYDLFSPINIVLFMTVTILAVAVIISTFYHFIKQEKLDENHYLLAFSVKKHLANMTATTKDDISCLHSIRVLSMLSIVTFHSFFHRAMFPLTQPVEYEIFEQSFLGKSIASFNISVDTFLLISGLLVIRTMLRDIEKSRFDVITFYFHRYMRLTPALAVCIIANIGLMKYLVAHFPYAFNHASVEPCETFWWSALLHTQIYTNAKQLVST